METPPAEFVPEPDDFNVMRLEIIRLEEQVRRLNAIIELQHKREMKSLSDTICRPGNLRQHMMKRLRFLETKNPFKDGIHD